MNEQITLGMLMQIFNIGGSIVATTYTFAAHSKWYWKFLWMFIGVTNLIGFILRFYL